MRMIVRSHELVHKGWAIAGKKDVITVFSSVDYRNTGNDGATPDATLDGLQHAAITDVSLAQSSRQRVRARLGAHSGVTAGRCNARVLTVACCSVGAAAVLMVTAEGKCSIKVLRREVAAPNSSETTRQSGSIAVSPRPV